MKTFADFEIDIGSKTSGQVKVKCPKCCPEGKRAYDLSVDITKKVWKCHKSSCGWTGTLNEFKPEPTVHFKKKPIRPAFTNNTSLPDNVIKWFSGRGISQSTITKTRIGYGLEWMPQVNNTVQTIQFHYWRGEDLINTKFRTSTKGFKLVSGAELILYNIDALKNSEKGIITEGEMDALSFIEAGFDYVVSVPNGANKNLEYLDNCYDEIKHIKKWYIAVDTDAAGQVLKDELLRRFGLDVCWNVLYPANCKDANEVLMKHGKSAVKDLIKNAKQPPLQDVIYVDDIRDRMRHNFINGKVRGTTTYFKTIDPHFTWKRGEVTLMGGIPNYGKTTVLLQLMLLQSVMIGTKWAVFSPENSPTEEFYDPLIESYIGKGTDPMFKQNQMSMEEYERGMDFIGKHFFYIFPENDAPTPDYINGRFKELIMRHGVDGCLIDPFNQLDKYQSLGNLRDDQYLSVFLTEEKRFAQKHNVYKLIIAHPKTLSKNKDGGFDAPDAYDLHGGSMWFNKLDNILCWHRPYYHISKENTTGLFISQKIKKHKLVGMPGEVELTYDRRSNRFLELGISPLELIGTNTHIPEEERGHPAQRETSVYEINNMPESEFDIPKTEDPPF